MKTTSQTPPTAAVSPVASSAGPAVHHPAVNDDAGQPTGTAADSFISGVLRQIEGAGTVSQLNAMLEPFVLRNNLLSDAWEKRRTELEQPKIERILAQ